MTPPTPGPYRVSRGSRGKLGQPKEEWTPIVSVATHWPGNGPDAILCEMSLDSTAFKFEGPHKGEHRVTVEEATATAHRFAAAPDLYTACEAFLNWYDGLLKEDEEAANERTEWVGFCEFEALAGNDDDIYVTADDPELTAIAGLMRAAIAKAREAA